MGKHQTGITKNTQLNWHHFEWTKELKKLERD